MLILRPDLHENLAFRLMDGEAAAGFIAANKQGKRSSFHWGLIWSLESTRGAENDLSAAWQAASSKWHLWKEWVLGSSNVDAELNSRQRFEESSDLMYHGESVGSVVVKSSCVTWVLGDPIIGFTGDAISIAAASRDATAAWRNFWLSAAGSK